jgi:hypothetical protein
MFVKDDITCKQSLQPSKQHQDEANYQPELSYDEQYVYEPDALDGDFAVGALLNGLCDHAPRSFS